MIVAMTILLTLSLLLTLSSWYFYSKAAKASRQAAVYRGVILRRDHESS